MIQAISASIPMALGIALSPLPIAAVVMMLMTKRAGTNSGAFLLGWVLGLLVVGLIVFLIPLDQSEKGEPTALAGYIRIALGVLLFVVAVRQLRNLPGPDETVEVPRILAGLDSYTAVQALATGFALVALNPKNLPLCAAGVAAISLVTQSVSGQLSAYIVFTIIASSTVALPIIVSVFAKQKAQALFETWKDWLIRNNQAVVAAILLIVGGILIARGLGIVATAT